MLAKLNVLAMLIICILLFIIGKLNGQLSGCDKNPCMNNAKCISEPSLLYGYRCQCTPEYSGYNCDNKKTSSGVINSGGGGGGNIDLSGGNINIGGGGTSNGGNGGFPGGISIGGGSINIPGSISSKCLNGGTYVQPGLPCRCPPGFSGNRCEKSSSSIYNSACSLNPCNRKGTCQPSSYPPGFKCFCNYGYTGQRCEYFRRSNNNQVLGISLGSLLPMLCCIACIGLCVYCCCLKNKNVEQSNRFIPNMPNFFNNNNMGPSNQINRPFQPVYANNHQQNRPATYNGPPLPDPDEVFKTNSSPPPYESIVVNKSVV